MRGSAADSAGSPHTTFEQARDAAMALLKGDPDRLAVLRDGLVTKARKIFPGKDA